MAKLLCEPTHLFIIIGVLLLALVCLGSGKGLGALVRPLIQKLSGKSPVTVNVGAGNDNSERRCPPPLTIADIRQIIGEVNREPVKCLISDGMAKDINFLVEECKSIWVEMKEVNKRQITLRERLPEQYVAKTDLIGIQDRLKSIDAKLDRYMELSILNVRK
jgi:hypothetical protein